MAHFTRNRLAMFRLKALLFAGFWLAVVLPMPLRAADAELEGNPDTKPATEPIALSRGAFEVAWYQPPDQPVRGLFILGSGDGGWSYWETRLARHLAKRGWAVAGVDFALYATTDFTQEIVATDFARMVADLNRRSEQTSALGHNAHAPSKITQQLPVIYGGWSMGAEQAIPAAAILAMRPAGLRGLLLVAPGPRGRYGLHTPDKLGITPTGEGLRLAQLHAGLDPLDSITWFKGLPLTLRLWKHPRAFHDFNNASDDFLALTDKAIDWVLEPSSSQKKTHDGHK
jgi:pimeloyl-ACP methyl ester carboxylesterase